MDKSLANKSQSISIVQFFFKFGIKRIKWYYISFYSDRQTQFSVEHSNVVKSIRSEHSKFKKKTVKERQKNCFGAEKKNWNRSESEKLAWTEINSERKRERKPKYRQSLQNYLNEIVYRLAEDAKSSQTHRPNSNQFDNLIKRLRACYVRKISVCSVIKHKRRERRETRQQQQKQYKINIYHKLTSHTPIFDQINCTKNKHLQSIAEK